VFLFKGRACSREAAKWSSLARKGGENKRRIRAPKARRERL
jgi:hypothetical protein